MAKRLGKPLGLTSDELDELARITDEDIQRVQKKWTSEQKRWAKNLLSASQPEILKGG